MQLLLYYITPRSHLYLSNLMFQNRNSSPVSSCVYYFKSSDTVYRRKGEIYEFFHILESTKITQYSQQSHCDQRSEARKGIMVRRGSVSFLTCGGGRYNVDKRGVAVRHRKNMIELSFGGGVAPEVDCARGCHPDQVRSQSSEQSCWTLVNPDMSA